MKCLKLASLSFALLAPLAGCGPADNDPGPGGVTVGEARALDEAAAMIEEGRLPEDALPESTGDNAPLPPETTPQESDEPE